MKERKKQKWSNQDIFVQKGKAIMCKIEWGKMFISKKRNKRWDEEN